MATSPFVPVLCCGTRPLQERCVGVELAWALTEVDIKEGRLQVAKLALSVDQARDLARSLTEQAALAEQ